ncbi:MAG: hypothetical protein ACPL06_04065 [Candidatus Anstonellales archaeon]
MVRPTDKSLIYFDFFNKEPNVFYTKNSEIAELGKPTAITSNKIIYFQKDSILIYSLNIDDENITRNVLYQKDLDKLALEIDIFDRNQPYTPLREIRTGSDNQKYLLIMYSNADEGYLYDMGFAVRLDEKIKIYLIRK